MSPSSQLSRIHLILAFAVMIAVGVGVYLVFPESVGGPPLPVSVSLGEAPVDTVGGDVAILTEVVKVKNELDEPLQNLAIEINEQYLLMQASPLGPGETLVLPQGVFTDKRSSQRFDPARQNVTDVIVRGQLPSKARGVSRFEFDE